MTATLGQKFSAQLEHFNEFAVANRSKSIHELSSELGWPKNVVVLFKYRFPILDEKEIALLDQAELPIEYEILGAICLYSFIHRREMIRRLKELQQAANPFNLFDEITNTLHQVHPLENLSPAYWKEVANYLTDREIDKPPFHKAAIGFIRSLNWKGGFKGQSELQKKWILDLMKADKKGFAVSGIFNNDFLKAKGLEKDYQLITKFYECL